MSVVVLLAPMMLPAARQWSMRVPILIGLIALAILLAGLGGWAGLSRISGAVIALGRVEVAGSWQLVQHPDGGSVAAVAIREGEAVSKGQLLLQLDARDLQTELAALDVQRFSLQVQRARLELEASGTSAPAFPQALIRMAESDPVLGDILDGQRQLLATRMAVRAQEAAQHDHEAQQIEAAIRGVAAQTGALLRQSRILQEELEDAESLHGKGLMRVSHIRAIERELARTEERLAEVTARGEQLRARLQEIAAERLHRAAARQEEVESRLATLTQDASRLASDRSAVTARIARLTLRAPVAGSVHQLQVTGPGAVLRAGDPVLYIVPQDRPLTIITQIDPADIDHLAIGQQVSLRFSGLSDQYAPEARGRLSGISADVITDPRLGISYYRAEITLDDPDADAPQLFPGMPAEAFIETGAQSPLRYLLRPFVDHLARAMREP